MKILIGVLMGMVRNVSPSCWSVSDHYCRNSQIIGDDGESCVQMQWRKIDGSEGIIKRDPCGCQFDMRGVKPKMLCKAHKG